MKIDVYHKLENRLVKEWEDAWKKSDKAHIFNSPYWYQACVNSKKYKKLLILVCRSIENNGEILGILPLVLSKRLGFSVYLSPGGKYLDKSTLFLTKDSEGAIKALLARLEEFGNYYLTEVSEMNTALISKAFPRAGISQCSIGRYLPIKDNSLKFVRQKNVRRTRKKIRDNEQYLNFRIASDDIVNNLKTIKEIEEESKKKSSFQTVFSDEFLIKLCLNLSKLNMKMLRISLLYHNNEPICYRYGFYVKNIYHSCNTAYKAKFVRLFPGKIITFLAIDYLIKEGLVGVDFSRGDNAFKKDFTPYTYKQYSIYHFNNIFIMSIWRLLYLMKKQLEKDDNLIEPVRIHANKIFGHYER